MKKISSLLILLLLVLSPGHAAEKSYYWRGLRVGKSTVKEVKKVLGEPLQEYKEQILYENQPFDPDDPNEQQLRLNTVVINVGAKGVIESIFLSPEWGTTEEQLRPFLGQGQKMSYRKFLSKFGEIKAGAGTRPDEKLHYVSLDAPSEVFSHHRLLVIYERQDVVTGSHLVKLMLFY